MSTEERKTAEETIEYVPYQKCPACDGYGQRQPIWNVGAPNSIVEECPACKGKGIILMKRIRHRN